MTETAGVAPGTGPPAFAEPWEARTFAMVKTLLQHGVLTPQEWSAALSEHDRRAETTADGDDDTSSFGPWLAALESLIVDKQLASVDALHRRRAAWERAARRTPHGQPVALATDDLHS